jgi:glycosyltransferase involved in cell wall biosynthesis
MSLRGSIIYLGNFHFPDGDAGARRVLGIGRCLTSAGYQVRFLGLEANGRLKDEAGSGLFSYDGFSYRPTALVGNSMAVKLRRLVFLHLTGLNLWDRINKTIDKSTRAVIAYQAFTPTLVWLHRFCDHRHIPLITDSVEWYDRGHVSGGRYGPFALDSELRMRWIHKRSDGIIAISRFLEDHYTKISDKPVVRVPPLVDSQEGYWGSANKEPTNADQITVAFVGNAGKKDLVINAIRGLSKLGEDSRRVRLVIVGPSYHEIESCLGHDARFLTRFRESLTIAGLLPWDQGLQYLAQSDFSLLLRKDARFSRAGFPTKLVESFAMGVPVIANAIGDIELYVRDGVEGLIIPNETDEAFASGLVRALRLSLADRKKMKQNARRMAEKSFDFRNWTKTLEEFLNLLGA